MPVHRRLLDVDPAYAPARAAIEDGVSVFIVATDDPATLEHFAATTAVEIRERVAVVEPGFDVAR